MARRNAISTPELVKRISEENHVSIESAEKFVQAIENQDILGVTSWNPMNNHIAKIAADHCGVPFSKMFDMIDTYYTLAQAVK